MDKSLSIIGTDKPYGHYLMVVKVTIWSSKCEAENCALIKLCACPKRKKEAGFYIMWAWSKIVHAHIVLLSYNTNSLSTF